MMPDKAKTTSIDLLYSHFEVARREVRRADGRTFTNYDISFLGDAEALLADHFLAKVNVSEEVAIVEEEVRGMTNVLLDTLQPELVRAEPVLCATCKDCEFRTAPYAESGFAATCLFDIDEAEVCGKKGTVGTRNERQLLQIRHTRAGTEYVGEGLGREMSAAAYPLHTKACGPTSRLPSSGVAIRWRRARRLSEF